ncbi:MAG: aa3-type cytochrome oxidase subunit II [Actinomycetes bacterium]
MGRKAPLVSAVLAASTLLLVTGCSSEDLPTFAMPARDVTNQAPRILSLWQGSWIAALSVGLLTWGLILWPVVAYRRKRNSTGLPPQTRYNLPIEVFYTVVPLIMIAVFFYFTARDESKIVATSAHPDHTITVTGVQWSWQFTYDTDGGPTATTTGTPAKPPTLYLPQGESVLFKLQSDDVIHSFWVPAFLFKMDVIPGQHNKFEITPKKIGTYAGRCAELCGKDHARMLFNVKIVTPQEYQARVAEVKTENAQ